MQKEDCAYCRRESHVKSLLLYGLEEKNPNFLERQLLTMEFSGFVYYLAQILSSQNLLYEG